MPGTSLNFSFTASPFWINFCSKGNDYTEKTPSGTPAVCYHALIAAQELAGRQIPHGKHHTVRTQTRQFLLAVSPWACFSPQDLARPHSGHASALQRGARCCRHKNGQVAARTSHLTSYLCWCLSHLLLESVNRANLCFDISSSLRALQGRPSTPS